VLQGGLAGLDAEAARFLADRYHLPQPRLALGRRLIGIAQAMLDVSDGLVGDLGHICEVSRVSAVLEAERVPLSPAARQVFAQDAGILNLILTGGDDYELVFAAPRERATEIAGLAAALGLPLTRIGRIAPGSGVRVVDGAGRDIALEHQGYRHF
jgi:thiamine-monophosphate kinase